MIGSFGFGCALFAAWLNAMPSNASGMAFYIFWPLLVPMLIASVALGLWLSHRYHRRALGENVQHEVC
jgi:hypothetical protein